MSIENNIKMQNSPNDEGEKQSFGFSRPSEENLRRACLTLWRRKLFILGVCFLCLVIGGLIVFQLQPLFTAKTQIMIETRQNKVTDIESVVSGLSPEMTAVLGEIEIIKSSALLNRLVDKLGLDGDPEFNTALQVKSIWKTFFNPANLVPKSWLEAVGLSLREEDLSEEELKEKIRAAVLLVLQKRIAVVPVRRSMVINISMTSKSPRKAARIINALADLYIVDQLEAKFEATKRATRWLSDRLSSLKTKVENSERAVNLFRTGMAAQIGQRSSITNQQISGLNTQLILAQTKRAEAKARLDQVEALLNAGGKDLATSAEVLNSMLIQRLRSQEAEVIRKVSELDSRYGPRHPNMIKAKSELRELRTSIELEVRKIAQSLRNEMAVARAREATLQKNLDRLEGKNAKQNRAAIRLRELEREAKASQILYSNFLGRFKETSSQEDLQQADARIISKATVPSFPSYPNKKLILTLVGFFGLCLAIGLTFFLEKIQNVFRGSDELEKDMGLPVLGITPKVKDNLVGASAVHRIPVERPTSAAAEAARSISTGIRLSNVDRSPRIIAVASSTPAEGKSTLALWLSQQEALGGKRVLLIDCDLRRPSIHRRLDLNNERNLVGLLAEEHSFEQVVQRDEGSGLDVVPGVDTGGSALDVLSSQRMSEFVSGLTEKYDLVVLDAPPVLAVADTRMIGKIADAVVYVVKWGGTPRDLVRTGVKLLLETRINVAGLVLSQVDTEKQGSYGYYDYGYYYGKYKGYYSS